VSNRVSTPSRCGATCTASGVAGASKDRGGSADTWIPLVACWVGVRCPIVAWGHARSTKVRFLGGPRMSTTARRLHEEPLVQVARAALCKPIIKWVGGKRQLLPRIFEHVPQSFGTYYEPFVGGAAVFFELCAQKRIKRRAVLGDMNEALVRMYTGVRDDVDDVIAGLNNAREKYVYDEATYYTHRSRYPAILGMGDSQVAAWMIYMMRCCFNGVWRVNKKGGHNVPFGKYDNPIICDEPVLRMASRALKRATLRHDDFEKIVRSAETGDFVYFDPPYVPVSETADFTAYTKAGFSFSDHERLRDCALKLKKRGVHVLLSNADVPLVRQLYKSSFNVHAVSAKRNVNCQAGKRGPVGEVLIT
jgi:DNA adenine methylase